MSVELTILLSIVVYLAACVAVGAFLAAGSGDDHDPTTEQK